MITEEGENSFSHVSAAGSSGDYDIDSDGSGNRTSELFLSSFTTTLFQSSGSVVSNFTSFLPMLLFPDADGGGENGSSFSKTSLIFATATTNSTFGDDTDKSSLYSSPATVFGVLVTFSICTIFGNSLVIIAVLREHYLKSPPNYFVASLAAADISVGILLIPFEATYQLLNRRWIFGDLWCELWHSFDVLLSTASILNLCVISLDRYWAICTPMSYPRRMTSKKACKFIALVWILAIVISLPAIFWWRSVRTGDIDPETCPFTEDVAYLISSSCISFYIPLSVMLFAYYKIYKAAVKQSRNIKQGAKLFSSNDTNGTGDITLTLRMHRGGGACCANGVSNERPAVLTQQRKSFSFGRSDPSGLSLLHNCKRTASVKVHTNKSRGIQSLSESTYPCTHPESSTIPAVDDGEGKQNDISGENDGSGGGVKSNVDVLGIDARPISSVDPSVSFLAPLLPLPINNNIPHRSRRLRSIPHISTPVLHNFSFRRNSHRRSFTVARKLAKFAKEKKAAKTLAFVLGVFITCWTPFFLANIVFALCKSCAEEHLILFEVVTWLGWINSAMNPLIYACLSPDFRRAFARLLGCSSCVRARQRRKSQRRFSVV